MYFRAFLQLILAAPQLLKLWFTVSKYIEEQKRLAKEQAILNAAKDYREAKTLEQEKTALEHIRKRLLE